MTKNSCLRMYLSTVITAFLLSACSQGADLTITNHSGVMLENVVAAGSEIVIRVGDIRDGSNWKGVIYPRGKSGLSLKFDADGHHVESPEVGYFEGVTRILLTQQWIHT